MVTEEKAFRLHALGVPARSWNNCRTRTCSGSTLETGGCPSIAGACFRLRIALAARYGDIIDECARAMATVSRRAVGRTRAPGCIVVGAYWKHWPCVFPQHGRGRKHRRTIELTTWQQDLVRRYPDRLLRGLIHSDGCRFLNRVNGTDYPRYQFRNTSEGIRVIFRSACGWFGIHCTQPRADVFSVARRADVARLDAVIGPKT